MNSTSIASGLLSKMVESGKADQLQHLVDSKLSDDHIKQQANDFIAARGGMDKVTSDDVVKRVSDQVLAKMDPRTKKELLKAIQKSVQSELSQG